MILKCMFHLLKGCGKYKKYLIFLIIDHYMIPMLIQHKSKRVLIY